jgi:hypothetical protein
MHAATPMTSVVPSETHRAPLLPKWRLRAVFALGVFLALTSQTKAAPEVFTASGSFEDEHGGQLSGTVTIDTATGKLLSADLIITEVLDGNQEIVFTHLSAKSVKAETLIEGLGTASDGIQLTLRASTLVGYKGGPIQTGTSWWIRPNARFGYPLNFGSFQPK